MRSVGPTGKQMSIPSMQFEAYAGPESEDALLWLFRKYPHIQSKFVNAPVQHDVCAPPFYEALVSFRRSFTRSFAVWSRRTSRVYLWPIHITHGWRAFLSHNGLYSLFHILNLDNSFRQKNIPLHTSESESFTLYSWRSFKYNDIRIVA